MADNAATAEQEPGEGSPQTGEQSGEQSGEGSKGSTEQTLRERVAGLERTVQNRTDEAKRVHKKYEAIVNEIGGEEQLEAFREFQKNQAKLEEERARKEGEFDKTIAKKDGRIRELEQELESERTKAKRYRIARKLMDASVNEEKGIRAHNPDQIVRLYGDDFDEDDDGNIHHRSEFNQDGKLMSPEEFLAAQMAGSGANLFRSQMKSGSGVAGGESTAPREGIVRIRRTRDGGILPGDQKLHDELVAKGEGERIKFERV